LGCSLFGVETVEKWTEMLTVQVFYGLKITPEQFMRQLESRWRNACPGAGDAQPIVGGVRLIPDA